MSDSFRTHDGRTLQQAASDLVQREVLCCMSSMVSTLASGSGRIISCRTRLTGDDLADLVEQAAELAAPVLDYGEAARDAGMVQDRTSGCWSDKEGTGYANAEQACSENEIDPNEWEVYEHWAVSTWFAEKLQAAGERVDTDFAGLCVWARTTTGQAISMDAVVERITREMHAD